ncbi:unnamed protein product [Polarella glacialis]|uniref:Uncharacterized protein n=1 Tax=Polarella glacialis TaxID=89957 RepID=A0A813LHA8_POLGL|nr:unnamed protein product [Polarella glacialis]
MLQRLAEAARRVSLGMSPAVHRASSSSSSAVACREPSASGTTERRHGQHWNRGSGQGANEQSLLGLASASLLGLALAAKTSAGPVKASDDRSHELSAEEQKTVALFERSRSRAS